MISDDKEMRLKAMKDAAFDVMRADVDRQIRSLMAMDPDNGSVEEIMRVTAKRYIEEGVSWIERSRIYENEPEIRNTYLSIALDHLRQAMLNL